MKSPVTVLSAADTAFLLRAKLGPIRAWADFLTDNIRGRQSIRGLTLKPCARKQDGKAYRPVYALADVQDFIANVLALDPKAGAAKLKTNTLSLDIGRPWRLNKFDQAGNPVATRQTPAIGIHRQSIQLH